MSPNHLLAWPALGPKLLGLEAPNTIVAPNVVRSAFLNASESDVWKIGTDVADPQIA
jgi:hypothetical protein